MHKTTQFLCDQAAALQQSATVLPLPPTSRQDGPQPYLPPPPMHPSLYKALEALAYPLSTTPDEPTPDDGELALHCIRRTTASHTPAAVPNSMLPACCKAARPMDEPITFHLLAAVDVQRGQWIARASFDRELKEVLDNGFDRIVESPSWVRP